MDPFSRQGAIEFLEPKLGAERATGLVDYLDGKAIADLYGNPLTLGLFGQVAAAGGAVPKSRAELLLRACEVLWSEHNDRHEGSPLSNLDQETALSAAGLLSAAFVLTGSEAITTKPSSAGTPHAVHVPTLRTLPGGDHARAVVGSRLFAAVPDAEDGFKPIHRSVAEFLGARWLAISTADEQTRVRASAMFEVDAGVPASLRGLHAWLAQDSRFASDVIARDPYGVLRYGDADGLGVDQGRRLLKALGELAKSDPFFRAEDWESHSAKGLTHVELRDDVRAILVDDGTTVHLRSLLLGAIRGSSLAATLAGELRDLVLGEGGRLRSYHERSDAMAAVAALDGGILDVADLIGRLMGSAEPEGRRLALDAMRMLRFAGFGAEDVARAVVTHVGPLDGPEAEEAGLDDGGLLFAVAREIPDDLVAPLLDALAATVPVDDVGRATPRRAELSELTTKLTLRQLGLGPTDPHRLLGWLRLGSVQSGLVDADRKAVASHLRRDADLRRAIQHDVMAAEIGRGAMANLSWHLDEVSEGLRPDAGDVIRLLCILAGGTERTEGETEVWRDLATHARRHEARAGEIIEAARPFATGDARLEAYLEALANPRVPTTWEVDRAARQQRQERERAEAWAAAREKFADHEDDLRAGALRWTLRPAQAYLGRFRDLDRAAAPADRVHEWLGPELQAAALAGFEATLGRPDLPTPRQVADGYADGRRWNVVDPLTAAVAQRMQDGRDLDDISTDALMIVGLALRHEPREQGSLQADVSGRVAELLRRDPASYERYVRLLIEPSLERRKTLVPTLHELGRSAVDEGLARRLAGEWLERHADLHIDVESGLVDVLVQDDDRAALRAIHARRMAAGFSDDQQRRNWQSVGLLVDLEGTVVALRSAPSVDRDLIWPVRHRLTQTHGRKRPSPVLPAMALAWLVSHFRASWPFQEMPSGVWGGDTNGWDAAAFIGTLVNRLGNDLTDEAVGEFARLVAEPEDGYTAAIRHAADQQRRARRETRFDGITLERLKDVVEVRPPKTTDDLEAIVSFALGRLQAQLRGSDTDVVGKYWREGDRPQVEDVCTDRMIEDLERVLPPHGIGRIPQRDMPAGKRADIVFTIGEAALPVECKGQWNPDLWTAPGDQLDAFYLRDWRSQDRGIYIVYWFGSSARPGYRLKAPPSGSTPSSPEELRQRLIQHVDPARRSNISVVVVDLTR